MLSKNTYVVVANSSLARIFIALSSTDLREIETFEHPESRMRAKDLVSDKQGRSFESSSSTRHAMEPKKNPSEVEHEHFAHDLCRYLDKECALGTFQKLYIAASPSFLGLIRETLNDSTKKAIVATLDKDITQSSIEAITTKMNDLSI